MSMSMSSRGSRARGGSGGRPGGHWWAGGGGHGHVPPRAKGPGCRAGWCTDARLSSGTIATDAGGDDADATGTETYCTVEYISTRSTRLACDAC